MLSEIIQSTQKTNLLAFFFAAPNRAFSIRELQLRLRISAPNLRKVIAEFVKLNILTVSQRKSAKLYFLNYKSKFVAEIKEGLNKAKVKFKYQDELLTAIKHLGTIDTVILSGVFVGQPQLPIDLLIVGKINQVKLARFIKATKQLLGLDLNYTVMSVEEYDLRKHTFDRFIKDIFDYPYLILLETIRKTRKTKSNRKSVLSSGIRDEKFKVTRF